MILRMMCTGLWIHVLLADRKIVLVPRVLLLEDAHRAPPPAPGMGQMNAVENDNVPNKRQHLALVRRMVVLWCTDCRV